MKYLSLILVSVLFIACSPITKHNYAKSSNGLHYWADTIYIDGHKIVNIHQGNRMGSFDAQDCPKCFAIFD